MIKIEFNGTGEEVRSEMLKLLGLTPEFSATSGLDISAEQGGKSGHSRRGRKKGAVIQEAWTDETVKRLLSEVRPNAKNILVELANKPDGYNRKELAAALNVQEESIRGQLSSLGAALKRMGGRLTPLSHEMIDGEFIYKLDTTVAAFLNQQA
jgi:hypothetical protein